MFTKTNLGILAKFPSTRNYPGVIIDTLYHGTSDIYLESIKENGLIVGNRKNPSNEKAIYFSPIDYYASGEAYNTTEYDEWTDTEGVGGNPIVLEIDINKLDVSLLDGDDECDWIVYTGDNVDKENPITIPASILYKANIPVDCIKEIHFIKNDMQKFNMKIYSENFELIKNLRQV